MIVADAIHVEIIVATIITTHVTIGVILVVDLDVEDVNHVTIGVILVVDLDVVDVIHVITAVIMDASIIVQELIHVLLIKSIQLLLHNRILNTFTRST